MPDQPAPEAAAASTSKRGRAVAAGSTTPRASATVPPAEAGTPAPAKPAKAAASGARKKAGTKVAPAQRTTPGIAPTPGGGEGAVLTAVATEDSTVAVLDPGAEGLKIDETVVAGPDGAEVEAVAAEEAAADSTEFEWDDEEESEALRQARKDAELTASADSVRAYLKQIGKVALLNAEEEVDLAKRIEAGLYAS